MSRSRCFIVQEPMKKNDDGVMESMMDMRKVIDYGEPIVLLRTGRLGFTPGPLVDTLNEKLRDYGENDYLVPTGDPTAICAAAIIASNANNGRLNVLKWDKVRKEYIHIRMDVHHRTRRED